MYELLLLDTGENLELIRKLMSCGIPSRLYSFLEEIHITPLISEGILRSFFLKCRRFCVYQLMKHGKQSPTSRATFFQARG